MASCEGEARPDCEGAFRTARALPRRAKGGGRGWIASADVVYGRSLPP